MTPMIDLFVHITLTPGELLALLAAASGTGLAWRDFMRALHDARAPQVRPPQLVRLVGAASVPARCLPAPSRDAGR